MKILSLHIKNFLSYHDEHIDFSALDYASISGKNGSGKSSIPDAVAWAFYGSLRVAGDSDSVVNDNANEAIVTLTIGDSEGTPQWQIVRRRNSKSGSGKIVLNYFEDGSWKSFGDQNSKTAQAQINKIVGLDKEAFFSLVIMESSAGTRFTQAKGTERRDILLSLVPELGHWAEREKIIKNNLDAVSPEVDRLESSLERYEEMRERSEERAERMREELEEIGEAPDFKKLDNRIEKTTKELAAASSDKSAVLDEKKAAEEAYHHRVEQAESKADSIGEKLADAKRHRIRYERLEEKLTTRQEELDTKLKELDELEDVEDHSVVIAGIEKDIDRIEKSISDQQSTLTLAKQLQSESNDRIELLEDSEGGQCYVCHTELPDEKLDELIDGAKADSKRGKNDFKEAQERIDNLRDKLETLEDKLTRVRRESEAHRTRKVRLESAIESARESLDEVKEDMESEKEGLPSKGDVDDLDEALKRSEEAIDDIEDEWTRKLEPAFDKRLAESENEEVDRLTENLADLKEERQDAQRVQDKISSIEGAINETQDSIKDLEDKHEKTRMKLRRTKLKVDDLKFLQSAFSPRGIPSMLLDSILGEIEDKQNEILTTLPGTENMQVEFRQARENKTGSGSRETLDIVVHTGEGNERRYESFSAGEQVKLAISNLFAMIAVFNERHPGMIDTLFLDEPLGVLDTDSVPAFVDVLRVIMGADIVSSIFVIAHDDRVIEALPQRLQVSRTDSNGSKIMVLN